MLSRESEQRINNLNAKDLANISWAFAKANYSYEKLFATLAREAARWMGQLEAQEPSLAFRLFFIFLDFGA